jgi:uncharacterized protein
MRVYCDSVILIYDQDATGPFHARAHARLSALRTAGDRIAVSDLSWMEGLVKPFQLGDATAVAEWERFFLQPDVQFVPINRLVFERAARIRGAHNFKTPDALHLAAAVEGGCDLFLTADARLARFPDIPVEILS